MLRAAMAEAAAPDVIATIRRHDDVPIVVSLDEEETELAGSALIAGATDLVDHPYRLEALHDLVRRRLPGIESQRLRAARVQIGGLVLDGPGYTAWVNAQQLPLRTREFELLQLLAHQSGRVVTFEDIRTLVWGARRQDMTRETVTVYTPRIWSQIAEAARIVTVRGLGYRLTAAEDS